MRNEFWYPPGFPWEDEWFLQRCALAMTVLAGFVAFLLQFSAALEALQAELLLHQVAELPDDLPAMPPLPGLMGGFGICFLLLALGQGVLALAHYLWHYQGGRSIYRMRTLPQRFELARRCLAAPAAALVRCALAALCAAALCALYYRIFTPAGLLPAHWLLGGALCWN